MYKARSVPFLYLTQSQQIQIDTKLQANSESCTCRFSVTVPKFVRIGHNSVMSSRKDIKEAYVAKIVAKLFRFSKMRMVKSNFGHSLVGNILR